MERYSIVRLGSRNLQKPYVVEDNFPSAPFHRKVGEYATLSAAQYAAKTQDWGLHGYAASRNAELLSTIKGRLAYLQEVVSEAEKKRLDDATFIVLADIADDLQRVVDAAGVSALRLPALDACGCPIDDEDKQNAAEEAQDKAARRAVANGTLLIMREALQEYEPHKFEAEASSLKLAPGVWPQQIKVDGLGNGQPFLRHHNLMSWGEVVGVIYRQEFGCLEITIQND